MKKRYTLDALFIGLAAGLLAALGLMFGVFDAWSHSTTDRFFLPHAADPKTVIVAIDDASLARIGRWPWDRSVQGDLVQRLTEGGAKVIALDVNFPEVSTAQEDTALAQAIKDSGRVILPLELSLELHNQKLTFDASKSVQPIAEIQRMAKRVGFSNTPLDADGVVRRIPLTVSGKSGGTVESFAYAAAELAGRAPDRNEIPTDAFGRVIVNFPGSSGKAFPFVSAADVLEGKADMSQFVGTTVFIGATAADLHDAQNTATSRNQPMSGIEIHASLYDTLVNHRWLVEVSKLWQALALLLAGLLLGLVIPRSRARSGALLAFSLWFGWVLAAFLAFDRGWILDIVWPTLLIIFAYAALLLERWISTERERRKIRSAFSQYVSVSVVEAIMKNIDRLKLGGDRRMMSVLFSDIRGFTSLSEDMAPEALVELLNNYLDKMTDIVFEEGGVLDKYIGDAVMAFWNAPFDQSDHAMRSVRTAIRMQNRLEEMNREGSFAKGIQLKIGIGINTGDMIVGNIGGERRYDYTVIGDSVNLASRTEGLCKEYGVGIIITKHTRDELDETIVTRQLDTVAVKGKKEPVAIYEVMGLVSNVDDARQKLATEFDKAMEQYFERNFEEAARLCEQILLVWPEDMPAKHLKNRCEIYQTTPPPVDWNGAWVMTKK